MVPFKIWLGQDGRYEKKNIGEWKKWETEPQKAEEFEALDWSEANGYGVILGTQAKNGMYLGVIDFDRKGLTEEAKTRGKEILKDLLTAP